MQHEQFMQSLQFYTSITVADRQNGVEDELTGLVLRRALGCKTELLTTK